MSSLQSSLPSLLQSQGYNSVPMPLIVLSTLVAGSFLLSYFSLSSPGEVKAERSPLESLFVAVKGPLESVILMNRERRRKGPGCGQSYEAEVVAGVNRVREVLLKGIEKVSTAFPGKQLRAVEIKGFTLEEDWEGVGQKVVDLVLASIAEENDSLKFRGPKANETYNFMIKEYKEFTISGQTNVRAIKDAMLEDRLYSEFEIEIEDLDNRPDFKKRKDIESLKKQLERLRRQHPSPYSDIRLVQDNPTKAS